MEEFEFVVFTLLKRVMVAPSISTSAGTNTPSINIGAEHARQLGLLVGGDEETAHRGGEVGRRLALQRLEHILEAAGIAETEHRRQVEGKDHGALDRAQLRRSRAIIASTVSARDVRCSYGFSRMTKNAWLDEAT